MEEDKRPHVWLNDDGAEEVFVAVDDNGELEVSQTGLSVVFTKNEARQLRNFLNENFKD